MSKLSSAVPLMSPPCDRSRIVPAVRRSQMLPPSLVRSAPPRIWVRVMPSARMFSCTERGARITKSSEQNVSGKSMTRAAEHEAPAVDAPRAVRTVQAVAHPLGRS